jgi:hypothetical protein
LELVIAIDWACAAGTSRLTVRVEVWPAVTDEGEKEAEVIAGPRMSKVTAAELAPWYSLAVAVTGNVAST